MSDTKQVVTILKTLNSKACQNCTVHPTDYATCLMCDVYQSINKLLGAEVNTK